MPTSIKISVVVVTCNHEAFIGDTLDGILMQKDVSGMEIIIADDCSTDNTIGIINSFVTKHPGLIQLYSSPASQGPMAMAQKCFALSKGTYMAWLDGDDHWTYEYKLRDQILFLDNNTEYAGCFHDAQLVPHFSEPQSKNERHYHRQWKNYAQFNKYTTDFYPWQLLERQLIPTASLVFRRNLLNADVFENYAWLKLSINWLLHLIIIRNSRFHYINEVWSVYNDHPQGISKREPKESFKKANIDILAQLLSDPYYMYLPKDMYKAISREYYQLLDLNKGRKVRLIKLTAKYILIEIKRIISELFYLYRKEKKD